VPAFTHLHVASAFSLRYGASTPEALVARAAEHGQPAIALTDRDGVYGAVRFALACAAAGLSPVLGVDLAVVTDAGLGARGIHRALRGAAPRHIIGIPRGLALARATRLPGRRIAVADLPAIAREGALAVLDDNAGHPGHIFNLGHGVQPDTDPAVLEAVVQLVHERTAR